MDFQNRAGSKPGSGGVASWSETNIERRERLRKLALETIDLSKDPYFLRNHLGSYECKLCLTLHPNEGSYLAHTQGKKHQGNLGRRAAKDMVEGSAAIKPVVAGTQVVPRSFVKIGRPGYKVTKVKDPYTGQLGLLFQVQYPDIGHQITPKYRIMSAFEQKVDVPPQRGWQYVLIAAEPYETVGFKIQDWPLDRGSEEGFFTHWDPDAKQYTIQMMFKQKEENKKAEG